MAEQEMNHSHILEAIKILTTPAATSTSEESPPHCQLDRLFEHNIRRVCAYLNKLSSSGEPIWNLFHNIDDKFQLECSLDSAVRDVHSGGDADNKCLSASENSLLHNHHHDKGTVDNKHDCGDDIRWQYTKCNLKLLVCLKITMESAAKKAKAQSNKGDDLSSSTREHTSSSIPGEHTVPELSPDSLSNKGDDLSSSTREHTSSSIPGEHTVPELSPDSLSNKGDDLSSSTREHTSSSIPAEHTVPELSPDSLSFNQQKLIMTSLQFVACLGICPCLIPGVGVPVDKRSAVGGLLQGAVKQRLTVADRETRMWTCARVLLDCSRHVTLGSLILNGHLADILAVLLQITYAPRKSVASHQNTDASHKPGTSNVSHQNTDISNLDSSKQIDEAKSNDQSEIEMRFLARESMRTEVRLKLDELIKQVYQPVLINNLLVLQAGAVPTSTQIAVRKACPAWLRRVCSPMLTDCLLRPNGIVNVFTVILDNNTGSSGGASFDWRRCEAAVGILSQCPDDTVLKETYYKAIAPQIMALLHNTQPIDMMYLKVLIGTISIMYSRDPELTHHYILDTHLAPLITCINVNLSVVTEPALYVTEERLECCVQDLHKLLILGKDPSHALLPVLDPVIGVLFQLYVFCRQGAVFIRKSVEELIVTYLMGCEVKKALMVLSHVTIQPPHNRQDIPVHTIWLINRRLVFSAGGNGGVCVLQKTDDSLSVDLESCEHVSSATIELLRLVKSNDLTAGYFMGCLQKMTEIVSVTVDEGTEDDDSADPELEFEKLCYNLTVLGLLSQISDTFDHEILLNNTAHILNFVKVTLDRCVLVLDNTEDACLGMFESETVTMAMGLLAAVLEGEVKLTDDDRAMSKELIPFLDRIIQAHPDPFLQTLASNLVVSLATHGHVKSDLLQADRKEWQKKQKEFAKAHKEDLQKSQHVEDSSSNSPLIEVLSNCDAKIIETENYTVAESPGHDIGGDIGKDSNTDGTSSEHTQSHVQNVGGTAKPFKQSDVPIPNMNNSKPPVNQSDLLLDMDGNAVNQSDDSLQNVGEAPPFTNHSDDSSKNGSAHLSNDTNDCLQNVQGATPVVNPSGDSCLQKTLEEVKDAEIPLKGHALIALRRLVEGKNADIVQKQDLIFHIFLENLNHSDTYIYLAAIQGLVSIAMINTDTVIRQLIDEYIQSGKSTELRMKIGEVLVKSSKQLGEMAPHYRDILLEGFLQTAHDPDHHIRASSLANMAQICQLLTYSLGPSIHQVFACIESSLRGDPEVEVRRAAAMFVHQLLQGLGRVTLKVLAESLKDLYRLLKLTLQTEKDQIIILHSQLAMEALSDIMRQFIFPELKLEKRIHVLSAPSS